MADIASSLRSARAYLDMKVKPVAAALRMSDNTLTQLERYADASDPKVADLVEFYEGFGLKFLREHGLINGIMPTTEVRQLTITAVSRPNPDEDIESLRKALRIINGLVYSVRRADKTKSNIADTLDVHFPVATREFVKSILVDWLTSHDDIKAVMANGASIPLTPATVGQLL